MKRSAIGWCWIVATVGLAASSQFPVDPPDLELNLVTSLIDTVDTTWSVNNYNVRFTEVKPTGEQTESFLLTSNPANDVDPRIACATNGDLVVAWWRDQTTDAVIYRKRSLVSGVWTLEQAAGVPTESASHPRVVYAGAKAWVAYQIQTSRNRSVGAQVIADDPEPTRAIVATTSFTGDLDILINAESGHLWITWIDSSSRVGYSEYNYTTLLWSAPALESYGSDSIAAARSRIRSRILGL
jgi:hypothetical protein